MKRNKSSKPRFNLDGQKLRTDELPLYLIYRYKKDGDGNTIKLKLNTGHKIKRRFWDEKAQRAKSSVYFPETKAEKINQDLRALEEAAIAFVKESPAIESSVLKSKLSAILKSVVTAVADSTIYYTDHYESYMNAADRDIKTIMKYRTTYKQLKQYESNKGSRLTFDDINPEFCDSYVAWCYDNTKKSSVNTFNKVFERLSRILCF